MKSNPTVRRYVVRVTHTDGSLFYLHENMEVDEEALGTHWGAPNAAYLAMDIYGRKVAERSAVEHKGLFMEVLNTLPAVKPGPKSYAYIRGLT